MKWTGLIVAMLGAGARAEAAGLDGLCPDAINTRQEAVDVPSDYTAGHHPGLYLLQDITFSDGLPGPQGTMAPNERHSGATLVRVWRFPVQKDGPIYFSCLYDNTTVTLVRLLDPALTKCEITYNASVLVGGSPKIQSSYCT